MVRIISNNDNNNEIENSDGDANPSYDEDEARSGNVKKGPWTPLEDMILTEYVKKHGEGNWNSVQKNSGLLRCGKSCRLRWANHLRPNLKKGAFSDDEEKIIIELHAKLGNKWARMAAQLPGRTDNEIKNFWNTRLKRRQRQGLPIYPPEIVDAEATAYNNRLKQQNFKQPFSSTSSQFSMLLNSCYPKKPNEPTPNSATNPIQNQQNSSANANNSTNPLSQFKLFNENRRSETLALPLSPISPISPISSISHYPSSSSTLLNQNFSAHNDTHDYQYSGRLSYDHGFIERNVYEYEYEPVLPLAPADSNTEMSSSQTAHDSATPASSYASAVDGLMGSSNSSLVNNDYYEVALPLSSSPAEGNSGLLDALVKEGNTLSRNDNGKVSYKRKHMEADEHGEDQEGAFPMGVPAMKKINGDTTNEVSKEKKQVVEDPFALGEMNSMDDDLSSLLDNFPSEMPTPEWYHKGKTQSLGLENEKEASSSSGPTNQEYAWTLGTCWNNMPGIC